jgi:hypothetical protein
MGDKTPEIFPAIPLGMPLAIFGFPLAQFAHGQLGAIIPSPMERSFFSL